MKKIALALLLLGACSDDATNSAQNNGEQDTGMDAVLLADSGGDSGSTLDAQADAQADALNDAGAESDAQVPVDLSPLGGDRPVTPILPDAYDSNAKHPLLIILHGYGATGAVQRFYFKTDSVQDNLNMIVLAPDGTTNASSQKFWNASDFCCDFEDTQVDDVAYITGLITEAKERFNVDDKRVFLMGHSNGGFMSYRMACERSDLIAGIVSLAGAMPLDTSACTPSEPVAVAQVHGTADTTILYAGQAGYPSARESIAFWTNHNGCDTSANTPDAIDISAEIGSETDIESFPGCTGGASELWTINLGSHIPGLNQEFPVKAMEFLLAHPKP
jgi:polyhydroxybutyrate depolymerase